MLFVQVEEGIPLRIVDEKTLRSIFSDTVFPKLIKDEHIEAFGFYCLAPVPVPDSIKESFKHRIAFNAELVGGVWTRVPFLEEVKEGLRSTRYEIKKERAIKKRNTLLAASDWVVLTDSPLGGSLLEDFKTYRQQLRDITQQEGFPFNIDWPSAPELGYN